jgi:hypothetical protein
MFTNSNAVKHKTLYAPRALLDVYALGTLKTLNSIDRDQWLNVTSESRDRI